MYERHSARIDRLPEQLSNSSVDDSIFESACATKALFVDVAVEFEEHGDVEGFWWGRRRWEAAVKVYERPRDVFFGVAYEPPRDVFVGVESPQRAFWVVAARAAIAPEVCEREVGLAAEEAEVEARELVFALLLAAWREAGRRAGWRRRAWRRAGWRAGRGRRGWGWTWRRRRRRWRWRWRWRWRRGWRWRGWWQRGEFVVAARVASVVATEVRLLETLAGDSLLLPEDACVTCAGVEARSRWRGRGWRERRGANGANGRGFFPHIWKLVPLDPVAADVQRRVFVI